MNILKKAFTTSRDGFMPSVFSQLDSKMSRPLSCRQELEDLILRNQQLAAITESYQKALAVSKQLADSKVKPLSTGICFAAQLDGRGRLLENVVGEVGCLGLDYDHLSTESMNLIFERIKLSPHTLIAYRTISGNGLRIIVGYQRPEGCELSFVELHQAMLQKAMALFDSLLGIKADRQCVDFLRLSGLAHDEQAFFNWDAEPIVLTDKELAKFTSSLLRKKDSKKQAAERSKAAKGSKANGFKLSAEKPTMEEVKMHVRPHTHHPYAGLPPRPGHLQEILLQVDRGDGGGMGHSGGGQPGDAHPGGQGRHLQEHVLQLPVAAAASRLLPQRVGGDIHRQGLHGGFLMQDPDVPRRVRHRFRQEPQCLQEQHDQTAFLHPKALRPIPQRPGPSRHSGGYHQQPADHHRPGEPTLLALDCGEHREPERRAVGLCGHLLPVCGSWQGGEGAKDAWRGWMGVLAHPGGHRRDAKTQHALHGAQLC